jgi:hypothetical protein
LLSTKIDPASVPIFSGTALANEPKPNAKAKRSFAKASRCEGVRQAGTTRSSNPDQSSLLAIAILALFGDVHDEGAPGDLLPIELADGFVASGLIGQSNKTEASGATATRTCHDERIFDLTDLAKDLAEIIGSGIEREVTYIESNGHNNK